MQLLATQEDLVNILHGNLSLISAQILKIVIYVDNDLVCIDIEIILLYPKKQSNNSLILKFIDVQEYSLYYLSHRIFYNIEIVKFFKYGSLFYISFDPIDEKEEVDDEDQDFIKAKFIEGYYN
ncbi:MAG: hypothetical protein IT249_04090 [Chitinophagaceae bacterium]|nr:hypothetical protein [Chitinophagaceae bacterium]